ncbi:MAG: hypothetical protein VKJ02_02030 [Snowella sp.]|nr:hypothetical protein [Snowella sp.]
MWVCGIGICYVVSELMVSNMQSGCLNFSSDLAEGVQHGEVLCLAEETSTLPTRESDTRYMESLEEGLGSHLDST